MQRLLKSHPDILFGVDLGQRSDYSAIAIIERSVWSTTNRHPVTYSFVTETTVIVRDIFRLPLGTPYPEVVDVIKRIAKSFEKRRLVVDATGLGAPVVDDLKRANIGCPIEPVMITTGNRVTQDAHGCFHVPKQHLVTALEDAIHRNRLRVSDTALEAKALLEELSAFQVKTSASGREIFTGEPHDDLVMATALANWRVRKLWS